jgi:hypothetical protein
MSAEQVARRRAVEALRSGVPSWDAVTELGSGQSEAEDRFAALLDGAEGGSSGGLLLGAGFGAGKSHVLTHLSAVALDRGFAVSSVVVSKETPLHDPAKVLRAAVDTLTGPGRVGGVLSDAIAALDPDSARYAELRRWVGSTASSLDERFAATLLLHERLAGGDVPESDDVLDAAVRFWAGEPLRLPDLRRALKGVGAGGQFAFPAVAARELARQRIRFLSRLLRAAGYAGWVVLLDEVELIGRYSLLQRAKSYAEVARWVRGDRDDPGAPLCAVLTTVDDFEVQVLVGKNDIELVPKKLRQKGTAEHDLLASQAEAGMRAIERDQVMLQPPDRDELDRTYLMLKRIHGEAYGWEPPDVEGLERLPSNRMRQYVRAWITGWDLLYVDPTYRPQVAADRVALDLTDAPELGGSDGDADGGPGPGPG